MDEEWRELFENLWRDQVDKKKNNVGSSVIGPSVRVGMTDFNEIASGKKEKEAMNI